MGMSPVMPMITVAHIIMRMGTIIIDTISGADPLI